MGAAVTYVGNDKSSKKFHLNTNRHQFCSYLYSPYIRAGFKTGRGHVDVPFFIAHNGKQYISI